MQEWDPIGVASIPEAQDGYDAYVSEMYEILVSRQPQQEIFEYLWWLETEHIGLGGDFQRAEKSR